MLLGAAAAAQTFWREVPVTEIEVASVTSMRRPGYRFVRRSIPQELVINRGESLLSHPALTALDLAIPSEGDSIDTVLRSKMVRIGDLETALAATPYRRGNRDRRRLLLESRAEPWSAAERLAHKVLHGAGITGWRANVPITLDGDNYFLDIAFTGLKLLVEVDGYEFHSRRDVFESDRLRRNALQLAGWIYRRYTYKQLSDDPAYVIRQVRSGILLAESRTRLARLEHIALSTT
ncbi:endonuclease domain-containing protein [Pseudactinotalea sp.]|uniref:endonuclease domain-containing protein n=1 Tax=Pseudactinotalea sp. TaxID=1926260 RepID=UPI003B3A6201